MLLILNNPLDCWSSGIICHNDHYELFVGANNRRKVYICVTVNVAAYLPLTSQSPVYILPLNFGICL